MGLFPARSRPLKSLSLGEDGIGGICDRHQAICFALALWNGHDAILKERLFGLTGSEGNHGEDVKEYYFYLDSTPTHSYMKFLYKYPQSAYPYAPLVEENRRRGRQALEYELLDTGVFDENRYFDIFVEYAKGSPEDILIRIQIINRGPETAALDLLPTIWFRNTWSWGYDVRRPHLNAGEALRNAWSSIWNITTMVSASSAEVLRNCSSPRTRRMTSVCTASTTIPSMSRMASTTTLCMASRRP